MDSEKPRYLPTIHSRQLRCYAIDPGLAQRFETAPISEIVLKIPWEDAEAGPTGEYLEVVDYDPTSKCFYEPVDLDDASLLAQDGLPPSEGTPQFHQQMVYAVARLTIANFERALGRPALWSPGPSRDPREPRDDSRYVPRLAHLSPRAPRSQTPTTARPRRRCSSATFRPSAAPRAITSPAAWSLPASRTTSSRTRRRTPCSTGSIAGSTTQRTRTCSPSTRPSPISWRSSSTSPSPRSFPTRSLARAATSARTRRCSGSSRGQFGRATGERERPPRRDRAVRSGDEDVEAPPARPRRVREHVRATPARRSSRRGHLRRLSLDLQRPRCRPLPARHRWNRRAARRRRSTPIWSSGWPTRPARRPTTC